MRSRSLHRSFHRSNIGNLATSGVLFALGSLACSGKLAVLGKRMPGEPGSDPDSMTDAPGSSVGGSGIVGGSGAGSMGSAEEADEGTSTGSSPFTPIDPSLANCRGLVVEGPFPNPYPRAPLDCGYCTCENGEPACTERACPAYQTLSRCPDGSESAPLAPTWDARIQGDTLLLKAQGIGGCNDVALLPCYVPAAFSTVASQSVYPRQATIRVLNPVPSSACDKVVFQSLQLGLQPLEEFRAPEGNLVKTTYGMAQIGELSCAEAGMLALDQFQRELGRMYAERSTRINCDSAADCVWTGRSSSCGGCLGGVSNETSAAQLSTELTRIENEICTPVAASCSALQQTNEGALNPNQDQGCAPAPIACRSHECVQVN
jgi:hypothetical protein